MIANLRNEITLWDLKYSTTQVRKSIMKKIEYLHVICILILLTTFSAGICFTREHTIDTKLFFALKFFEEYFPQKKVFFITTYIYTFPFASIIMTAHAIQCIYYTQHIVFQVKMFQQFMLNIFKHKKYSVCNYQHQKQIYGFLSFCVRRHQHFIR